MIILTDCHSVWPHERDTLCFTYLYLSSLSHMLRLSLLHPFAGTALTSSNKCGVIVQLLKSSNPVILTSLQLHCQHYREAGIYAALLTHRGKVFGSNYNSLFDFISSHNERARSSLPTYNIAMVTGYALSLMCDWLESDCCPAKRKLSLSSIEELMSFVNTFLGYTPSLSSLPYQITGWSTISTKQSTYNYSPPPSLQFILSAYCYHTQTICRVCLWRRSQTVGYIT